MNRHRCSNNRYFRIAVFLLVTICLIFYPYTNHTLVVKAADNYIYFPQNIIYFDEAGGTTYIPVEIVKGNWYTATAYFSIQDITATFGTDYIILLDNISSRDAGTTYIILTRINDTLPEVDEEFVITFTSGDILNDPANGCYASCTVVIIDDDEVNDPDSCILASSIMTPLADTISSESEASFEIQHTIEVTDNSTSGMGWELILNFDNFITLKQNSVDDPCLSGTNDYIQTIIPTEECMESITLTSIEYPDNTVDETDIAVDLTSIQSGDGTSSIIVAGDDSGDTGVYYITIKIVTNFDCWLPVGTIITAGGNGCRFDGNPTDTQDNDYVVQVDDKIQVFAGQYDWDIDYEAIRPLSP